ncbi:MAG TPA: ROK family transcriptional regulator, partial [Pseudolabrys sp.]|nr:ROK family transcriptional regulator [Pseudolabrys sp.]
MALKGTNQEFGRPYNRRLVLETIRLHAPVARSAIAKRVGLTVQTVSTIIRELDLQGFVRGARVRPRGRGLPPTFLAINPEGGFAIGIHVTPISLKAALINLAGEVIGARERPLPQMRPDIAFREIGKLVAGLRKLRPDGRMLGIGLAMPGPFDVESMSFIGPTTLEGWKGIPVQDRLVKLTGLPAFIEVD